MRIYLDACCLNRPFDDQTQDRIHLEAEAVLLILAHLETREWEWIGSDVLDFEIEQTHDASRRCRVKLLASFRHESVHLGGTELKRAAWLESLGFHAFDALHLACAESGNADVFLTTDDQLLQMAMRCTGQLKTTVGNPLTWIKEVI